MCVLAVVAKERDTGSMSPSGVRSRVPWGLLVCAMLVPAAACTAVAGVGGFEVDPCFDGCDGGSAGGEGGSETSVPPDGSLDSPVGPDADAATDSPVEAAACACPSGTQPINGACAVTAAGAPSVHCTTPLQLPDNCAIKAVLHVCDGDPAFTSAGTMCVADASATRPSGFVRLGTTASGKWNVKIVAAYSASRPNGICTQGGAPCLAGGTASSNFTTTTTPNNDVIAIGKRDDVSGCQDIEIDVTPN
jgi:hypothetical protein